MSIIEASGPDSAGAAAIEAELARLFAAPQFARAPVMRRLLTYLTDQTLAGNGERLKAYTIAVDGLGRDPDFDAKQDSYPRVQVGRLRQLLDDVYTAAGPRAGMRIHIPKGAYAVEFAPSRETAKQAFDGGDAASRRSALPMRQWVIMIGIAIASAFIAVVAVHAFYDAADERAEYSGDAGSAKPVAGIVMR